MIHRKSFLYNIIWIVYSVIAIGFSALVFTKAANMLGKDEGLGLLMLLPVLVLMNLGVFFSAKLRIGMQASKLAAQDNNSRLWPVVFKLVIPAILIVCGILLRAGSYRSAAFSFGNYYELVRIDGNKLYMPIHAATGIYYGFLRGVLYLFGNHPDTLIVFQIVTQLIAGILLYIAAYRIAGRLQAGILLAFLMLSPYSIRLCFELSPIFIYLIFVAITFIVISFCTKNNLYSIIIAAVAGMFAGELIMMDISGLIFIPGILILFFIGKKTIDSKNKISELQDKVVLLISFYSFMIVGIVFITICYLISTGNTFSAIISDTFSQYKTAIFSLNSLRDNIDLSTGIIVSILLLMGILGGFRRIDFNVGAVFVIILGLLIFLCGTGMIDGNMHGEYLIFIMLCVLAGEAIYDVTFAKLPYVADSAKAENEEELKHTVHRIVEEVEMLDNPLPVPEKKKKKKLEYDYYVPDEADYDL